MATRLKEAIKVCKQNKKCSEFKPHSSPCRECDFSGACARLKRKLANDTLIKSKQKMRSIRLREGSILKSQKKNAELDEEIKESINCNESNFEYTDDSWYLEIYWKYNEFDDSNYGPQNNF